MTLRSNRSRLHLMSEQNKNMNMKQKILNWLGLSWVATHVDEVINTVVEFRVQKVTFQYYRNQLDTIIESRRKAKEAVEKGREDRRRKDTLVTGKVNDLLKFLGISCGSLLLSPPVVEPIINLTRLTEAVHDLAKKAKETNRIARKTAESIGLREEVEACYGIPSPDYVRATTDCCATTATRPGYVTERFQRQAERIEQLEKALQQEKLFSQDLSAGLFKVYGDVELITRHLGIKLVDKPEVTKPAARVVVARRARVS